MLLATILLLGALPRSGELARSAANVPEAVRVAANDSGAARELPSMPKPKVAADADGIAGVNSAEAASAAGSGNATGGAAGGFRQLRHGNKSAAAAVFAFRRDVCGDAGQPGSDGFYRQAHDGQRKSLGAQDVVVAAGGGLGIFRFRRRAQSERGAGDQS